MPFGDKSGPMGGGPATGRGLGGCVPTETSLASVKAQLKKRGVKKKKTISKVAKLILANRCRALGRAGGGFGRAGMPKMALEPYTPNLSRCARRRRFRGGQDA